MNIIQIRLSNDKSTIFRRFSETFRKKERKQRKHQKKSQKHKQQKTNKTKPPKTPKIWPNVAVGRLFAKSLCFFFCVCVCVFFFGCFGLCGLFVFLVAWASILCTVQEACAKPLITERGHEVYRPLVLGPRHCSRTRCLQVVK